MTSYGLHQRNYYEKHKEEINRRRKEKSARHQRFYDAKKKLEKLLKFRLP